MFKYPMLRMLSYGGNHSSIQYPDVTHATLKTPAGEKPVRGLVGDDTWLNREFIITA
uniref:Uncharacterized protein n=1 Tax=Vitis vinifera TaxID=29760 RepID=F6HG80_VITVI